MGILDEVIQMRNQGVPDEQIISSLQQQGVSPREITDALGQAQIKNAVAGENQEIPMPSQELPSEDVQGEYDPQYQGAYENTPPQEEVYMQQQYQQPMQGQEYYEQDLYAGGYAQASTGTDNMIEVAEQVFSEKMKKLQKKVDQLDEFRTLAQTKIDSTAERLKRIESSLDKMQITILEKISSYGKGFEQTKKELKMVEDSFAKIAKKVASTRHSTTHHKTTPHKRKTHKRK